MPDEQLAKELEREWLLKASIVEAADFQDRTEQYLQSTGRPGRRARDESGDCSPGQTNVRRRLAPPLQGEEGAALDQCHNNIWGGRETASSQMMPSPGCLAPREELPTSNESQQNARVLQEEDSPNDALPAFQAGGRDHEKGHQERNVGCAPHCAAAQTTGAGSSSDDARDTTGAGPSSDDARDTTALEGLSPQDGALLG